MLGGGTVNYALPEDMMGVRGWTGNAVYQAGQACAIRMYLDSYDEQRGGFISTPEMDLSGDVVLTFRARALKAGESGIIRVALCDNYEDLLTTATSTSATHGRTIPSVLIRRRSTRTISSSFRQKT